MKAFAIACSLLTIVSVSAFEFEQKNREVVVQSARLRAIVRDGRITHLQNRRTGAVYADSRLNESSHTAGLGCMIGQEKELSRLHFPWGEPKLNQHIMIKEVSLYHRPTEQSKFTVEKQQNGITAVWNGLSDGKKFFPDETLSIHFSEDANGALVFEGRGASPGKGVFAIQIPLENISQNSTFLLPTFGGLEYSGKGTRGLMTFQSTVQFYEAPVMICTLGKDVVSMWSEDSSFRPFFAFFTRDRKSCSFALEFTNIIPFEQHEKTVSNPVKLDVFEDCDWIEGARPYRDWYHRTFSKEISARDSIEWANKISVIVDEVINSKSVLEKICKLMPAENVMFQIWQARKEGFTKNLPDYTPKKMYPGHVKLLHEHGFKVMCYTCALCVTYQSPVWKRDHLEKFILPRKMTITNYKGNRSAFDENLVGNIIRTEKGTDPFAKVKPGKLIYSDPLSEKWRDYYTSVLQDFASKTGTDAFYQDTLGVTTDNGNGIINGLWGGMGNAQLARDLQRKVGLPLASEYGPAPIGFAIKWPLNYAQVWGGQAFRESRLHRHRPLTPFLFGYRTWVPTAVANDDFKKHLISSVSDALSGMGMFSTGAGLQKEQDFSGHLVLRSQIFAENGLVPYYPRKRYPVNVRAMYQSKTGGIYHYYDDGKLQMLLDPAGKPLYGRINGMTELKRSDLQLTRWPIWDKDGIYSLNPAKSYALFPRNSSTRTRLRIDPLDRNQRLAYYFDTPHFSYVEIDALPKNKKQNPEGSVSLDIPAGFTSVICNDKTLSVQPGKNIFKGTLPLRLVVSNGNSSVPDAVRKISQDSGLMIGATEKLPHFKKIAGKKLYFINKFHSKSLDCMMKIESPDAAVEVWLQNTQNRYGNGSSVELLVNGKRVAFLDCLRPNPEWKKGAKTSKYIFDTRLWKWKVPLGKFAGSHVLISLRVDNKKSDNADMQWVSVPELIKDAGQKFTEEVVPLPESSKPAGVAALRPAERPAGKPVSIHKPDWHGKAIVDQKTEFLYSPDTVHGVTYSQQKMPVEPSKRYYLSCDLKKSSEKTSSVIIGVVQYDAKGREIHGIHVNPVAKTETNLSHPAKKGSKKISVMDASNWTPGLMVAMNVREDQKNAPVFSLAGPVEQIWKNGGDWTISLKRPLPADFESDSPVRLHKQTGTHYYICSGTPVKDWCSVGREIKWRPGAVAWRILIISKKPFLFRNLQMEIYNR